jgi:hypothetical protein
LKNIANADKTSAKSTEACKINKTIADTMRKSRDFIGASFISVRQNPLQTVPEGT